MAGNGKRAGFNGVAAMALAGMLVLGACSPGPQVAEQAQPVLVMHPAPGPGTAVAAFAGEIRARQESALAFRVAGNIIRRSVDLGDRVKRGDILAELDPADLRLQAQATRAQLAAAEAELARASADRSRYAALARQQLVSRSQADAQN